MVPVSASRHPFFSSLNCALDKLLSQLAAAPLCGMRFMCGLCSMYVLVLISSVTYSESRLVSSLSPAVESIWW